MLKIIAVIDFIDCLINHEIGIKQTVMGSRYVQIYSHRSTKKHKTRHDKTNMFN